MRVAEPLQEGAVVRHEHDGAGVVGEERLQPRDGVDVEVVGRLVEQQQIGLRDQRPRQQHAPPPAARQRVDDGVGRQVQASEHHLNALLERASRPAPPVRAAGGPGAPDPRQSPRSATATAAWW